MKSRIRSILISFSCFAIYLMNTGFLLAAQQEEESPPEWILSYALVMLGIGLGLVVVIRSHGRKNSIISEYERKAMRDEEIKKAGGGH